MRDFEFDVVIIGGFGHVGLPLGITLADAGFTVGLYDIDASKCRVIEAGKMPFTEYGAEPILKRVIGDTLFVSPDIDCVSRARVIIITIGTPIDEYLSPRTAPLFVLADSLLPHLSADQCVVLRSTVYPGTSRRLQAHFTQKGSPAHLAYCPERIVQGHAIEELRKLPQIVSGFSEKALQMSRELFTSLGVEIIETEPEEAEMVKLFLNAWRYIQFAASNQFFVVAKERGLDYSRILHAMKHHYDRARDLPGPGFAAGPCLLKDTMQLAAANRNQFLLGHAAMMINEGLPAFLLHSLQAEGVVLAGKTVGILGMAFKANIDDARESLSYKLRKLLAFHGAQVLCSDEFIRDPAFVSKEDLTRADLVIVGVPHDAYRGLHVPPGTRVVDLWGVLS